MSDEKPGRGKMAGGIGQRVRGYDEEADLTSNCHPCPAEARRKTSTQRSKPERTAGYGRLQKRRMRLVAVYKGASIPRVLE